MRNLALTCLFFMLCQTVSAADPFGTIYQPSYCQDFELRGPGRPYVPQAGDLVLGSDDHNHFWDVTFRLAGTGPPYHSALVIKMPDGSFGSLESGPDDTRWVELMELEPRMRFFRCHRGRLYVRQRITPLTEEQSACLTQFAMSEHGKRFALARLGSQLTPFRCRGPLRTEFCGKPLGPHSSYFCSELLLEAMVYSGLLNAETTRPRATYPRDMFYDRSLNPYINKNLDLSCDWLPPAAWTCECDNCARQKKSPLFKPDPTAVPVHPCVKDKPRETLFPWYR